MLFEFRGETFFLGGTDWNIQRKILYILFHRFTSVEKVTLERQLTGTGAKSRIIIRSSTSVEKVFLSASYVLERLLVEG